MKTVQFKDLPWQVQGFLIRTSLNHYNGDSLLMLAALHNEYDWSKATDDERLAYAEWRYPRGTKGIDYYGDMFVSEWKPCVIGTGGEIYVCDGGTVWFENKWAEIIEEPEIDSNKDNIPVDNEPEKIMEIEKQKTFEIPLVERKYADFVKSFLLSNNKYDSKNLTQEQHEYFVSVVYATLKAVNHFKEEQPESQTINVEPLKVSLKHLSEIDEEGRKKIMELINDVKPSIEPESKAGDEVDHKFVNSEWLSEGLHFTGGVTSQGLYICEDKHGSLKQCEQIRKPDPDKHLREIAKEILKEWDLLKGEDDLCDPDVYSAIMEMGKRVEALKKGKSL